VTNVGVAPRGSHLPKTHILFLHVSTRQIKCKKEKEKAQEEKMGGAWEEA